MPKHNAGKDSFAQMTPDTARSKKKQSGQIAQVAGLLVILVLASLPCAAAKRRFTVADDIGLAHFGDPYTLEAEAVTFSPDGRFFVVDTERGLIDQDRPESTLRVFRTDDVRQFLHSSEAVPEPSPVWTLNKSTYKDGPIITQIRWLADSSGIAFLAKTGSGNAQLFLANLTTKSVDTLTAEDQDVTAFDIRSRRSFVYSVRSPTIRERAVAESEAPSSVGTGRSLYSMEFPADLYPSEARKYDLSQFWAVVDETRTRITDMSSHRPLSLYSTGQRALALSPTGRFAVTAIPVSIVPADWETVYRPPMPSDVYRIRAGKQDLESFTGYGYASEYAVIDLVTGNLKVLTGAPTADSAGWWSALVSADWSPDGESVVVSNTFLQGAVKLPKDQANRPCIAVIDIAKDTATCLEYLKGQAKTKSGYEEGFRFVDRVRYAAARNDRVGLHYFNLDGSEGSASYVRSPDGSWRLDSAVNGSSLQDLPIDVSVKQDMNHPPVLVATDRSTKASRVIFDPNPQIKDVDLGKATVFKWKDPTGRELSGGLYTPSDLQAGRRYPLVVQTHGFSEVVFRPEGIFPTAFAARELAVQGMVVLQTPDCPITVDPKESACNVAVYDSAVEQLVANGLVDPTRVGIIGFSRTCYYVLDSLTKGKTHFKAASITDGVNEGYFQYISSVDSASDLIEHEADAMIGAPPFGSGLQKWLEHSPEFNLDKVTAPMQIVAVGRLSLLTMWEPYAALRRLNEPVDLLVLREGTHVLTNPSERMASQGGTVDWFRFWLQGEEDPDPAKAEQYARWRELRKLQEQNKEKSANAASPTSN